MSETDLQRRLMLHWSASGVRLFRNNCGMLRDTRGSFVRYGVGNPGGSDLIGWTPVVITPEMVGRTMAVFTAIETKSGKRKTTPEQSRFLAAVQAAGGIGTVAWTDADFEKALSRFLL